MQTTTCRPLHVLHYHFLMTSERVIFELYFSVFLFCFHVVLSVFKWTLGEVSYFNGCDKQKLLGNVFEKLQKHFLFVVSKKMFDEQSFVTMFCDHPSVFSKFTNPTSLLGLFYLCTVGSAQHELAKWFWEIFRL